MANVEEELCKNDFEQRLKSGLKQNLLVAQLELGSCLVPLCTES